MSTRHSTNGQGTGRSAGGLVSIWSLWEKAGSPPEQQDRLMDWLADAIKASAKDSIGPLPPDPKFGDGQIVPEQLVKQLTQPPAAKPPTPSKPENQAGRARQPADELMLGPELQARSPLPLRVPDPSRAIDAAKQPAEDSRGPASRGSCRAFARRAPPGRGAVVARLSSRKARRPQRAPSRVPVAVRHGGPIAAQTGGVRRVTGEAGGIPGGTPIAWPDGAAATPSNHRRPLAGRTSTPR